MARPLPAALLGWTLGLFCGAALVAEASPIPFDRLAVFAEALSIIEGRYVDERNPDELVYDAIGGLTQGLDDHSVFLDPQQARDLKEQTTGEYTGVGVSLDVRDGHVWIEAILAGSPAEGSTLRVGDELLAVDGLRVEAAGADPVTDRIKGTVGTMVVLTVRSARETEEREIAIRRDHVRAQSVDARRVDDRVAVLRIERFLPHTGDEVKRALADLGRHAPKPEALLIDLRGNPGGYLREAVAVADLWLPDGPIVWTLDRGSPAHRDDARGPGTDEDTRLVVLVNSESASAAEIVAGALQDTHRATLVGYTTYGKGSVQQFFDLDDGSALKITVARYLTPSRRSIHGSGIEPDLSLGEKGAAHSAKDLNAAMAQAPPSPPWMDADPDLRFALWTARDEAAARAALAAAPLRPAAP
jgi:carboxyl-terminal processing protease